MALATLPLVLCVLMVELAIGGAFLMWYIDRTEAAPSGFLKLTAFVDAGAIAFAGILLPALPRGKAIADAGLDVNAIGSFAEVLVVVIVLVVAQLITSFMPWKGVREMVGILTVLAGVFDLVLAAVARPSTSPFDVFALVALPLGALALGGADAAMLLGHWYLVTPKLSSGPLQRAALVLVGAVVLQIVLVAVAVARGEITLNMEVAFVVAASLRVGVGLFMTLAVALAAWWTARMNTQASTGLLFVGLGCVLAGEVSARVLFFLTGAAV
ncbi:MAG TPA: hypothetical protein VGS17_10645 [Candidatus Limnocylindria bacterium]|nr:hypothetical protein [Candidatus Limnocylindria bacterium]